ncbi:fibroblast growth factor 19 [Osmerus eperlanus]|uniref:fibroblast growth factor 19 n=1 Tax=Osmerus eperlanus TaxID=29151 RepID=UPI002E13FA64
MQVKVFTAFCIVNIVFGYGVVSLPLPDSGPYISNGWGQTVRLRHLYAAKHGLHVSLHGDGKVHSSVEQSPQSLLEIRSVNTGSVAIRGVAASQYLCMESDGRLYASSTYTDDCSFREKVLSDGYNVYISEKHETLVSLGPHRQRHQGRDRGLPALAQFLPRMSTLESGATEVPTGPQEQSPTTGLHTDILEGFGRLSQVLLHSPSFSHT